MGLLLDDMPLVVSPRLAQLIGLNEAIVLQQIHYWLSDKKQSTGKVINGTKWIYNSIASWEKQFPFMSYRTIQRTLKNLKNAGLLLTGVFNKDKRDKTLWYTIDYKTFNKTTKADHARCQNGILDDANLADTEHANLASPLPENTTEITTEIKKINKKDSVTIDGMVNSIQGLSKELAQEYFDYRAGKNKPLTARAWSGIAKTLEEWRRIGGDITDALIKAMEKDWTGIEVDWLRNVTPSELILKPGETLAKGTSLTKVEGWFHDGMDYWKDPKLFDPESGLSWYVIYQTDPHKLPSDVRATFEKRYGKR